MPQELLHPLLSRHYDWCVNEELTAEQFYEGAFRELNRVGIWLTMERTEWGPVRGSQRVMRCVWWSDFFVTFFSLHILCPAHFIW